MGKEGVCARRILAGGTGRDLDGVLWDNMVYAVTKWKEDNIQWGIRVLRRMLQRCSNLLS